MQQHKAIPCCAARRSVSTCGAPFWAPSTKGRCSSDWLVMPPPSLTRWAPVLTMRACEKEESITKLGRTITTGGAECHPVGTRRSHTRTTDTHVCGVGLKLRAYITRTGIDRITMSTTLSRCANDATSSRTIAPRTSQVRLYSERKHALSVGARSSQQGRGAHGATVACLLTSNGAGSFRRNVANRRRYSQYRWKQRTNTLNYGQGARKLSYALGYPQRIAEENPEWSQKQVEYAAKEEAQDLIDTYFSQIPGAHRFIKGTHRRVADTKYVESVLGRRRWLPDIMDWDEQQLHEHRAQQRGRSACWCDLCRKSRDAERQSVNTIIQGSAADVVMLAMIRCENDCDLRELGVKQQLQIHDEIVFEVPNESVDDALPIIQHHMEHPGLHLDVPLRAEPNAGSNWIEAKG